MALLDLNIDDKTIGTRHDSSYDRNVGFLGEESVNKDPLSAAGPPYKTSDNLQNSIIMIDFTRPFNITPKVLRPVDFEFSLKAIKKFSATGFRLPAPRISALPIKSQNSLIYSYIYWGLPKM